MAELVKLPDGRNAWYWYPDNKPEMRALYANCPNCEKGIRADATECRHCGWLAKGAVEDGYLKAAHKKLPVAQQTRLPTCNEYRDYQRDLFDECVADAGSFYNVNKSVTSAPTNPLQGGDDTVYDHNAVIRIACEFFDKRCSHYYYSERAKRGNVAEKG